jgi:hypothetical protein
MKGKLLISLVMIYCQLSNAQIVKGKVICNTYAVSKVEVINSTQKKITMSDADGNFLISAKANDILVFISKQHQLRSFTVNPLLFTNGELLVELILNAEELNEVLVTTMPSIKLSKDQKWEQGKLDQYTLEKNAQRLNVVGVNRHTIENGMDFVRIGKLIGSLFKKEKDSEQPKKSNSSASFKTIAKNSCDQRFFIETLKLKPEQIDLFLQFCESDPKSNTLLQDSNELALMEFLLHKNTEFRKL